MSRMRDETLEIPDVIARQLKENAPALEKLLAKLQAHPPEFILTAARGSSDHAALFAQYLWEIEFGLVVSSAHPSVYTLYKAPMKIEKSLIAAFSQSGQSPDICEVMKYGKEKGALTLALVNEVGSPLAKQAEYVLPLHAGAEKSVAATKSYVAMLVAALHVTALVKKDEVLLKALHALPEQLKSLAHYDFNPLFGYYQDVVNSLIIGRGFGFPIAEEIALKFKEVTQIHAESFSAAEVLHGPFSLFNEMFPVFIFMQNDAALPSLQALVSKIRKTPVVPILVGDAKTLRGNEDLPHILLPQTHPLASSILTVFLMYRFIEQLAQLKGLNPDEPPLIQKVTKTV